MGVCRINCLLNFMKQIIIFILLTQQILCQTFSKTDSNYKDTLSNISSISFQNKTKTVLKNVILNVSEIDTILEQFDEINEELKTLEEILSSLYLKSKVRTVRSLGGQPKCAISKDELINLKNTIENLYSETSSNNFCTQHLNATDNCIELVKSIQCGLQHFKKSFEDAFKVKNGSLDELLKWKLAYESILDKYDKPSDNLKQVLSQENQLKLDKLTNDLQKLGSEFSTALESLQNVTFNLCVSEINLGQIQEALEHFKKLKSISISQIIKKCYNFQNYNDELKHFENIINFIQQQPNVSDEKIACETLYNEMYSKNELKSLKVVLLAYVIRNCRVKDEVAIELIHLKIEHIYLDNVKDLWTNVIVNNIKDEKLTNFMENYHIYFDEILSDTLRKAIKSRHDALTNKFDNVIKFIKYLPHFHQKATAYSTLFTELKIQNLIDNNDKIIKLAYNIKQIMKTDNYSNANQKYKNYIDLIKWTIPDSARSLIWHGIGGCQLLNRKTNQYLYADEYMSTHNKLRRTILTQHYRILNIHNESQWIFETNDQGDTFTIKNYYTNEYLYAAADDLNYGNHRRSVFTWKPGDLVPEASWKIKLSGEYITLQNTYYHNEYLYSSIHMVSWYQNPTHRVFTWGLGEYDMGIEHEWKLFC